MAEIAANPFKELLSRRTPLMTAEGHFYQDGTPGANINTSSIDTYLINNCGRFCESYTSDFLISRASIQETIDSENPEEAESDFWLGLRRQGVDHLAFIVSRMESDLSNYASEYYRKLYCVRVIHQDKDIFVRLYDCTNDIYSLARQVREGKLADNIREESECEPYQYYLYRIKNLIRKCHGNMDLAMQIARKKGYVNSDADTISHTLHALTVQINTCLDNMQK